MGIFFFNGKRVQILLKVIWGVGIKQLNGLANSLQ